MRSKKTKPEVRFVTVDRGYVISFKRRRSGRLVNVTVDADGVVDACRRARAYLVDKFGTRAAALREYGVSRQREMQTLHCSYGLSGYRSEWRRDAWDGDLNGIVREVIQGARP